MIYKHRPLSAFSLVELSIVLVILGLLVGGVLSGQSLIRAAELRATTSQFAQYHASYFSFRDKYFGIPGDLTNATQFWGIAAGSTGSDDTCYAAVVTNDTCNGDGNGQISGQSNATGANTLNERFRFWQHLALAGLIEGSFTGATDGGGNNLRTPGKNIPAGKMPNSSYQTHYVASAGGEYYAATVGRNVLNLSAISAGAGVLKPEEAWNIDTKLDDGKPGLGKINTFLDSGALGPNCSNGDTSSAEYDFTITATNCRLMYHID